MIMAHTGPPWHPAGGGPLTLYYDRTGGVVLHATSDRLLLTVGEVLVIKQGIYADCKYLCPFQSDHTTNGALGECAIVRHTPQPHPVLTNLLAPLYITNT